MNATNKTFLQCAVCKRLYPSSFSFQGHVKRSHNGFGSTKAVLVTADGTPVVRANRAGENNLTSNVIEEVAERNTGTGTQIDEHVPENRIEDQGVVENEIINCSLPRREKELSGFSSSLNGGDYSDCEPSADGYSFNNGELTSESEQDILRDDFSIEADSFYNLDCDTLIDAPAAVETCSGGAFSPAPFSKGSDVADAVFSFYDKFGDESAPLFADVIQLTPSIDQLTFSSRHLIQHCTKLQMTLGEAEREWELLEKRESRLPRKHWEIKRDFDSGAAFRKYVDRARKFKAREEGWMKAIIRTRYGLNCTGVFRSTLELARQEITAAGGIKAIQRYSEKYEEGKRVYSSPWDSEAMREYSESDQNIVLVDIFCDGTLLAASGSQSASPVRFRFSNLKHRSLDWHEVGILPVLTRPDSGQILSRAGSERERMELLHRFLFVSLKDIITASAKGFFVENSLLYIRVGMFVLDQKQERPVFTLKAAGTFRECTSCDMVSRGKRKRCNEPIHTRISDGESASVKRRRISYGRDDSQSNCISEEQSSRCISQSLNDSDSNEQCSVHEEVWQTQMSPVNAEKRDVSETVNRQLLVAESKRMGKARQRHSNSFLREVASANKYLTNMAAHSFPPAPAAFHGLGTRPFRLYNSVAFDKLHAFDLGPLREIPDNAFILFSKAESSHLPVTSLVSTANQRLLDMPRAAQLPSVEIFKYSKNQKQAAMTGSRRRLFIPFLGLAVMGLAKDVAPDDDELVQVCLRFADINRRMNGINMPARCSRKSFEEIVELQQSCFEAGTSLANLFDKRVNTKLHRVMRHVQDHLFDYGCLRRGSTDENETLHRKTKRAYNSTNKHFTEIGPQLVAARLNISSTGQDLNELGDNITSSLLLTRDPFSSLQHNRTETVSENISSEFETGEYSLLYSISDEEDDGPEETADVIQEVSAETIKGLQTLLREQECPESACRKLESLAHASTHQAMWTRRVRARFCASFPWAKEMRVWQTVHASLPGSVSHGSRTSRRNDSIEYFHDGVTRKGTLQAIFSSSCNKSVLAIIMRLVQISPEPGNESIVYKFGNIRFKYALDESEKIILDCIRLSDFRRQIMIVPDVYHVSRRYGVYQRLSRLQNALEDLKGDRFFELTSYKYTSLATSIC